MKNPRLGLYNNTIYFGGGLNIFIFGNNRSGYTLDGTLFHETTHVGLRTLDVVIQINPFRSAYSISDCLGLSIINKQRNANNWRYAYEKIYNGGV